MNDNERHQSDLEGPIVLAQLCQEDAVALDNLLEAKRQGSGAKLANGRTAKVDSLLSLINQYGQEDKSNNRADENDLTTRTLQYIHSAQKRQQFAQSAYTSSGKGFKLPWREMATIAAIVLIGTSLLFPVLDSTRAQSIRQACMANLAAVGRSIASYASDHQNQMPHYKSAKQGSTWWDTGDLAHSNSAQLYKMVKDGYATAGQLSCPGNEYAPKLGTLTRQNNDWPNHQAVSYSYQNQFTNNPIRLASASKMAILADKNPLILKRMGEMMLDMHLPHDLASPNHADRGQNILKVNGSVTWAHSPTIMDNTGQDNIWLMHGVSSYNGTESPIGHDSFLVP